MNYQEEYRQKLVTAEQAAAERHIAAAAIIEIIFFISLYSLIPFDNTRLNSGNKLARTPR